MKELENHLSLKALLCKSICSLIICPIGRAVFKSKVIQQLQAGMSFGCLLFVYLGFQVEKRYILIFKNQSNKSQTLKNPNKTPTYFFFHSICNQKIRFVVPIQLLLWSGKTVDLKDFVILKYRRPYRPLQSLGYPQEFRHLVLHDIFKLIYKCHQLTFVVIIQYLYSGISSASFIEGSSSSNNKLYKKLLSRTRPLFSGVPSCQLPFANFK